MKKIALLLLCVCFLLSACSSVNGDGTTEFSQGTVGTSNTTQTYETLHATITRTTGATLNTDDGLLFSDEEYDRFAVETYNRTTWNIEIVIGNIERIYDEEYGYGIKFDLEMYDYDNLGFYRYKSYGLEYLDGDEWIRVNKMTYTDGYSRGFAMPKKDGRAHTRMPNNYYYSNEEPLPAGIYRVSKLVNDKMIIFAEFELK